MSNIELRIDSSEDLGKLLVTYRDHLEDEIKLLEKHLGEKTEETDSTFLEKLLTKSKNDRDLLNAVIISAETDNFFTLLQLFQKMFQSLSQEITGDSFTEAEHTIIRSLSHPLENNFVCSKLSLELKPIDWGYKFKRHYSKLRDEN